MKKIFKTAIISSCFFLGLTIIIAYFISDNFFDQISNNAGASLNFALKILMLGFVFSIVYHGMAKFLNKIFGVVNNKNNENTQGATPCRTCKLTSKIKYDRMEENICCFTF